MARNRQSSFQDKLDQKSAELKESDPFQNQYSKSYEFLKRFKHMNRREISNEIQKYMLSSHTSSPSIDHESADDQLNETKSRSDMTEDILQSKQSDAKIEPELFDSGSKQSPTAWYNMSSCPILIPTSSSTDDQLLDTNVNKQKTYLSEDFETMSCCASQRSMFANKTKCAIDQGTILKMQDESPFHPDLITKVQEDQYEQSRNYLYTATPVSPFRTRQVTDDNSMPQTTVGRYLVENTKNIHTISTDDEDDMQPPSTVHIPLLDIPSEDNLSVEPNKNLNTARLTNTVQPHKDPSTGRLSNASFSIQSHKDLSTGRLANSTFSVKPHKDPSTGRLTNAVQPHKDPITGRLSNASFSIQSHKDLSTGRLNNAILSVQLQEDLDTGRSPDAKVLTETDMTMNLSENNMCLPIQAAITSATQQVEQQDLFSPQKQNIIQELAYGDPHIKLSARSDELNDLVSLKPRHSPGGVITIHQLFPDVVDVSKFIQNVPPTVVDSKFSNNVPVCQSNVDTVICQTPYDRSYDDSIFPTKHKLGTSEDMRFAMTQARSQNNYKGLDDKKRFPYSVRGDVYTKYRQVMAKTHRRSFNQWKGDISSRACQEQELIEGHITATYSPLEKIFPVGCPSCLQFNMSNIYGKPCNCRTMINQKLSRKRSNTRSKTDLQRKNATSSRQCINKSEPESVADQLDQSESSEMYPSLCPSDNDVVHWRNIVTTGLLSDLVSKPPGQTHRNRSTLKVATCSDDPSSSLQDHNISSAQEDHTSCLQVVTRVSSGTTTPSCKTSLRFEDLAILNKPESKSTPLRKWEINNLETTLIKCVNRTNEISKSLGKFGDFWSLHMK